MSGAARIWGTCLLSLLSLVGCKPGPASTPPVEPTPEAPAPPVALADEEPAPEAMVAPAEPAADPLPPPVELRVVRTNRVEYELSGYGALHPVGAAAGAKPWLEVIEELGPCEELWTSVDPVPSAEAHPVVMAQLICDNGADYATRELRTMLIRYDLERGSAELLWSGGGSSTNEVDACVSYEVHAFAGSKDGKAIEVLRQSEVIRGEEAAEFGLECTAEAFRSRVVDRIELAP